MKKMSRQEVEHQLITLAAQLLKESGESQHRDINLSSSLQRHLGIDSLARAELFRRIEKNFDVTLSDRLMAEADSLQDIANDLLAAGSKKIIIKQERIASHGTRPHDLPSGAKTLMEVLMFHGKNTPDRTHIYFQQEDGEERIITYGGLLES